MPAQVLNLSREGLYLTTDTVPTLGMPVRCRFRLGRTPRELTGRVAWVSRTRSDSGDVGLEGAGAGIEFTDLTQDDQTTLAEVLDQISQSAPHTKPLPVENLSVWFEGLSAPVRTQGQVAPGEIVVTTLLPFLRVGSDVKIGLTGEDGLHYRYARIEGLALDSLEADEPPRIVVTMRATDAVLKEAGELASAMRSRGEAFSESAPNRSRRVSDVPRGAITPSPQVLGEPAATRSIRGPGHTLGPIPQPRQEGFTKEWGAPRVSSATPPPVPRSMTPPPVPRSMTPPPVPRSMTPPPVPRSMTPPPVPRSMTPPPVPRSMTPPPVAALIAAAESSGGRQLLAAPTALSTSPPVSVGPSVAVPENRAQVSPWKWVAASALVLAVCIAGAGVLSGRPSSPSPAPGQAVVRVETILRPERVAPHIAQAPKPRLTAMEIPVDVSTKPVTTRPVSALAASAAKVPVASVATAKNAAPVAEPAAAGAQVVPPTSDDVLASTTNARDEESAPSPSTAAPDEQAAAKPAAVESPDDEATAPAPSPSGEAVTAVQSEIPPPPQYQRAPFSFEQGPDSTTVIVPLMGISKPTEVLALAPQPGVVVILTKAKLPRRAAMYSVKHPIIDFVSLETRPLGVYVRVLFGGKAQGYKVKNSLGELRIIVSHKR